MPPRTPQRPIAPEPPAQASQPAAAIQLDPLIAAAVDELQAAEAEIQDLTSKLAAAREKAAGARGKLDMLGQLQHMTFQGGRK